MGQIISYNNAHTMHNKIMGEIENTIREYQTWSKPEICNELTMIYHDKLVHLESTSLAGITASIGLKYDNGANKEEICSLIINHYQKRVELLMEIKSALEKLYSKIVKTKSGPVCRNINEYVDDLLVCKQMNGLWVNQDQYQVIINNIKKTPNYKTWISHIEHLDKNWKKYLTKLSTIIKILRNNKLANTSFDELVRHANEVIRKMGYVCDIYCLLIINF